MTVNLSGTFTDCGLSVAALTLGGVCVRLGWEIGGLLWTIL